MGSQVTRQERRWLEQGTSMSQAWCARKSKAMKRLGRKRSRREAANLMQEALAA